MRDESDLVRKEIDQIQREQPEIKRKINLYSEALMKRRTASDARRPYRKEGKDL